MTKDFIYNINYNQIKFQTDKQRVTPYNKHSPTALNDLISTRFSSSKLFSNFQLNSCLIPLRISSIYFILSISFSFVAKFYISSVE